MLTKLLAIAWKDIYSAFKDRNAMVYMFAAPLALSAIIGLAFGSSGDVSIDEVPVAVANQDSGVTLPTGETFVLGQTYQDVFVPTGDAETDSDYETVHDLTDGEVAEDLEDAREQVEEGELAAVIEIPADFSQQALGGDGTSAVEVYYDSGRSVGPSVVTSIVHYITNSMNTVILAQRVGPAALAELGHDLGLDEAAIGEAAASLNSQAMSVAQPPPIQLQQVDLKGETRSFDALQYFAPSMAILFMTFTMAVGGTSILIEQRSWTLQRITTTPTPRWIFMAGKLTGTYLTGVVQMIVLIVTTMLVALMMGRETAVWGDNVVGLGLMVMAVSFTATSLGLLIAALSKTASQADTYSTVTLLVLGMLGGTFIPIENLPDALGWLPKITLNYWGIQGFVELSYNEATLVEIGPHLLALALMGAVLFAISLWRFNRRLDL